MTEGYSIERSYYDAAFQPPRRLLNVELLAFSLGHYTMLRWMGNAFVCGGLPTIDDLISGTWVCSLSFRESLAALRAGHIEVVERRRFWWDRRRTIPVMEAIARWQRIIGAFDFSEKRREFERYIAEGMQGPTTRTTREQKADMSSLGCPDTLAIKALLMSKLSLSDDAVMDRPFGQCLWEQAALLDQDGSVRFMNPLSIDFAKDAADEMQKAIDEGRFQELIQQVRKS